MDRHSTHTSDRICGSRRGLCFVTWLNIVTQTAFPLAGAFAPALASANSHSVQRRVEAPSAQTRTYTLSPGETVDSVARKFNMSAMSLRKLNQFRIFARGFDHLQPGDELDVPVAPLPLATQDDGHAALTGQEDGQAQKVAGYASQAGSFLASGAGGDAAASMARGMASGAASDEIQQWLSRFGTARVQLDADKNFSLKNSQFDLLMPLYDHENNLMFTQGSLHRTDSRTQANLGAGLRHFTPTYMLGGNLFGDYDLSRDHARAGAGLEYWRDFLKLSANGYMRLTGWKDSPDLVDYLERPANGWDVRAQAWLPSLPQLGGKLTYEQYYGKEVALFGVDNRQKNPHAITAGINYTPVPLITLGAEQRQGQSGKSDTRLTVDMNYQLGVPWHSQVNPDAVAAMRSLTGSRYDLVERNNNIVLEYRKKEVIRLHTARLVTGYGGERKSLGVSVTSKYGLKQIDWTAPELLTAGGKIAQNGADYVVEMPAYQSAAQALNTYTVSGVAVDTKGNRSDHSETQVTVQAPEVSKTASTFTPESSELSADGKSTQVLTLTVRDTRGEVVNVNIADIDLQSGTLKSAAVSALTQKSSGVYTVTVTAGTDTETVTLTPVVLGVALKPAEVLITDTIPDPAHSAIITDKSGYTVGDDMTVTVTLRNKFNTPLPGKLNVLTAGTVAVPDAEVKTGSYWTDNDDGTYTVIYTAKTAGTGLKASLKPGNWHNSVQSEPYTITATEADPAHSDIATDKTAYVAGDNMTVTVTLRDAQDSPLAGQLDVLAAGTVTVPHAELKNGSRWTDNRDGTYTAIYSAKTAGADLKASLKLSSWGGAIQQSAPYTITSTNADKDHSAIVTDKKNYVSGDDMVITVTLRDMYDNLLTGRLDVLTAGTVTVPHAELKTGSRWKDNRDGTYTTTYSANIMGASLKASLKLADWTGSTESDTYTITSADADREHSAIVVDKTTYTAGEDMTVTVTLKDVNDNAVTGAATSLTADTVTVQNAVLKTSSQWKDNNDGTYSATYTAQTTGTGLKASLKMGNWTGAIQSGTYAITATDPDMTHSTVVTDKVTYVSGSDMIITVTLRDAYDNLLAGKRDVLNTATMTAENAVLKTGSQWKDNNDGTYTIMYTAKTAGTGLKVSLKLNSWSGAAQSEAYAITAAEPDPAHSTIVTDKSLYTAGDDIEVTVTLRDLNNNMVEGTVAALTTEAVTVSGAELKTDRNWTDNNDGTYSATYMAETAGTGQKALLKLGGWSTLVQSGDYEIRHGAPDAKNSYILVLVKGGILQNTFKSGDIATVSVILMDAWNNSFHDKDMMVTVPNMVPEDGSNWSSDDVSVKHYIPTANGEMLKATLKVKGWEKPNLSNEYSITGFEPVTVSGVSVNGYTFTPDAGFPKTGFKGAEFTLVLKDGDASDYTWKSDSSWVSVTTDGVVTFTDKGTGSRVTITGTPKSGAGRNIEYSFTLQSWFINHGMQSYYNAKQYCQNQQPEYTMPSVRQLGGSGNYNHGSRGKLGELWSEWGDVGGYEASEITSGGYWTSNVINTMPYYVMLNNGITIASDNMDRGSFTICRRAL